MRNRLRTLPGGVQPALAAFAFGLVFLLAGSASALSVGLRWTATTGAGATGSDTIMAMPGDQLTLELFLAPETGDDGVSSYGVSLRFDTGGDDALDIVSVTEELPGAFQFNLDAGVSDTRDSMPGMAGAIDTFEGASFADGPVDGEHLIGTVVFLVTANLGASTDVLSGLFNSGIDAIFDNNNEDLASRTQFASATVLGAPVPEPGASLALLSSALLVWGARRSLR